MNSDLLLLLLNQSSETYLLYSKRLLFQVSGADIILEFNNSENIDIEETYAPLEQSHLAPFSKSPIESIIITAYTRQEETNTSYSLLLFDILKQTISKAIYKGIDDYELTPFWGYNDSGMCDIEPYNAFHIHISKSHYLNIEFWRAILDIILEVGNSLYSTFYSRIVEFNSQELIDISSFNILVTNTKTRRLAYFRALASFIFERKRIRKNVINKTFEKNVSHLEGELDKNIYSKGLIKESKTGSSAKHYLDLAENLNLLNQLNSYYTLSPQFKTYYELTRLFDNIPSPKLFKNNFFILSQLDCYYWLEILLKKDALYISLIIEALYLLESPSNSELVSFFHPFLNQRLEELNINNKPISRVHRNYSYYLKILDTKKRVLNWEKPKKYLEHVLMPRLNWLYDLQLADNNNGKIYLTEYGINLFHQLCMMYDTASQRIIVNSFILDNYYTSLFHKTYHSRSIINDNSWENDSFIRDIIKKCILESLSLFKTIAPNRVTASQAIQYTKTIIYISNSILIEKSDIENYLRSNLNTTFDYYYQKKYNDGYIQLKKTK